MQIYIAVLVNLMKDKIIVFSKRKENEPVINLGQSH